MKLGSKVYFEMSVFDNETNGKEVIVYELPLVNVERPTFLRGISFDVSNVGIDTNTGFKAYISTNKDGSNPIAQYNSADKTISGYAKNEKSNFFTLYK